MRFSPLNRTLITFSLWSFLLSPSVSARQMILPNTGSNNPPGYIGQNSELGQGPSNPSTYLRPNVTPPTWFQRDSCTPGLLGTLSGDSGASVSDSDFNSSYRCFSRIAPDLNQQSPGQAGEVQNQVEQPEKPSGQAAGQAGPSTPKNPVPAPVPLQESGVAPLQARPPSNLNSGLNNIPGIGDYRTKSGDSTDPNDGLGSSSGAVGGTNLQ